MQICIYYVQYMRGIWCKFFLLRKNVRVQTLTDSVKIKCLMQNILDFLSCDLTTPYRSELPSRVCMIEIKSLMWGRLLISRDMCTSVIMYMPIQPRVPLSLNFFWGGGGACTPTPPLHPPVKRTCTVTPGIL